MVADELGLVMALVGATLLAIIVGIRSWKKHSILVWHRRFRESTANAFFVWIGVFFALFVAAPIALGIAALVVAALAFRRWAPPRAAPLADAAEGHARFEGKAHAIGESTHVPTTQLPAVFWLAAQEDRRWTSAQRFEVRSDTRKVLVDPEAARVRGDAWLPGLVTSKQIATELPHATGEELRIWRITEGQAIVVIGDARLEADAEVATYREPVRVALFTGDLEIVDVSYDRVVRAFAVRIAIAIALGAGAGALAILR